jgi:hypothetical protein
LKDKIDWGCELHLHFNDVNKGSKWGMAESISWFFEHEEEGIILEDDIIPDISFFYFCQELLPMYRDDERIWAINGNNLMSDWPNPNKEAYYFSAHGYGAYWGWAGWRRSWAKFDILMSDWPEYRDSGKLDSYFLSKDERVEGTALFEKTWDERIPRAWDYQFDYAKVKAGAMNIIPTRTLTRNIGFGDGATHGVSENIPHNRPDLYRAEFPLVHPKYVEVDSARDLAHFRKYIKPTSFRIFKNKLKSMLPKGVDNALTPILSRIQRKFGLS